MTGQFKKIAIEAALRSGLFIKRSVGKVGKVSYKGIDNIVTDVDKSSEDIIINKILSRFPDHSILSEERGAIDSHSIYKWIIDPIDGTTNFAHSFPFFSVSIALEKEGEVVMGVVYDPMRDELFYAQKGHGAYLNNRKIRVSKIKRLSESFLATGFSYGSEGKIRNLVNFKNFLIQSLGVRRAGSAALDLCYVGCGRFDGFWELDLHPWDSAAGMLIVTEAKGRVTKFDGSPFSLYKKEVLATNSLIHNEMVNILEE